MNELDSKLLEYNESIASRCAVLLPLLSLLLFLPPVAIRGGDGGADARQDVGETEGAWLQSSEMDGAFAEGKAADGLKGGGAESYGSC